MIRMKTAYRARFCWTARQNRPVLTGRAPLIPSRSGRQSAVFLGHCSRNSNYLEWVPALGAGVPRFELGGEIESIR